MENLLIVSTDGHWGGPPSVYREYIDPAFRDDLDALVPIDAEWRAGSLTQRRFSEATLELIDAEHTIRSGGELGAWMLERRLAEMDREGVAAEVLLSGHQEAVLPFFDHTSPLSAPGHRAAGARAYHRHLADVLGQSAGRLKGVGDPGPCLDMAATVQELNWLAERDFVGVAAPGSVADASLAPLYDPHFEPFWATCAEAGLAVVIHAGFGFAQGLAQSMGAMAPMVDAGGTEDLLRMSTLSNDELSHLSIDQFPRDHPFRTALTEPRRALWQLMMSGVFDRHPKLQLVFTEIRADWVPDTLEILDQWFAEHPGLLARPPREYWADHVWLAVSSPRRHEVARRHEIGLNRFMFGTDYPHPEGTWPNTHDWIRHAFAGVPPEEARRILGQNALDCYGLDGVALGEVAARIGPRTNDVLGEHTVSDDLVAQFHHRSGYLRPPENVDRAVYEDMLTLDQAGVAATRRQ